MKENQTKWVEGFKAKNARRDEGRSRATDRRRAREARADRRRLGGAFGRLSAKEFNELVYGTTGLER